MLTILKAKLFIHEPNYAKFYYFGDCCPSTDPRDSESRLMEIGFYSCPCTCGFKCDYWSGLSEHIEFCHPDRMPPPAHNLSDETSIGRGIIRAAKAAGVRL